ncbi:hypothetical protein ACFV42_23315 [Streptomyces solisilvae]|uniref:hypothetical protein n=1 Tax=Streptomyces malaysiensis TaxID=92644 RepID=UPI003683F98B
MAQVICPSFSGAAVLRATKLDGCCRPIFEDPDSPGGSGQVTTDAFINVVVSPDGGDNAGSGQADENPVTKADGQVCFTTVSCPAPTNYSISLELCALDPELVLIMKPAWCPIRDSTGTIIGFTSVSGGGCEPSGFALEVWMNVGSGAGRACAQSRGGSQHGYLLFPCITGVQIGQWSITNGPITFSFSGTTRRSSGWGKGPYNILMDGTRPTPLPCPVRPNADFVQFVTTFPPPEAGCGMQPVDGGIPEPAEIFIKRGSNITGCLAEVRADNHGYGPVRVRWGDGAETELREGQIGQHRYGGTCDDPGTDPARYTMTICDVQYPQICTTRTLTLPLPKDEPVIRCVQDPADATGRTVLVEADLPSQAWSGTPDADTTKCACPGESPIGYYGLQVDWGEDETGDRRQYVAVGDDGHVTLRHTYTSDGRFPIKVCRNDQPNFCTRCTFTAGGLRPNVTFISWDQSCTASVNIDNNGRGTVSVDWGDGSRPQTGIKEGTISHSYADGLGRSFLIMVCSQAIDGGCRSLQTPACTGGGTDLVAVDAVCDPTDPDGRTFKVTADNRGHGTVVISATGGGRTDNPNNAGDGQDVTTITYPADAGGEQTISAADPDEPGRTGSDTITVPCEPGPEVTAVCDPSDDHHVTLQPSPSVKYPITVDWDDGTVQTYQAGASIQHRYWKEGDPLQPQRAATALEGTPLTLSQTTVYQQADIDHTSGDLYLTQLINGGRKLTGETAAISFDNRARYGHLAVSRIVDGKLSSAMYLIGATPGPAHGFDHGSGIGVQRDGSVVRLFTGIDPTDPGAGKNGYATQVARFTYSANQVLSADGSGIDRYDPRPDSDHVNPCLDLDHGNIAVRHRSQDGQYHITVWKLDAFLARNFASPVYDSKVNDGTQPTGGAFQCWCVYGKYVYHFYGTGDQDNAYFTVTDISGATGNVVSRIDNKQFPDLTYREAESIYVMPADQGPRLAWGFATGTTGKRRANLYATPPHRTSQPVQITVRDADGLTTIATGITQIPCTTAPDPKTPTVTAAACPADRNKVQIRYDNPNQRGVRIHWIPQDPNPTTHAAAEGTVTSPREYAPGSYTIRVQDIEDSTKFSEITMCLPCGTINPSVDCAPADSNPAGRTVVLRVGPCAHLPLDVNWGDGKTDQNLDPAKEHLHTYDPPGEDQDDTWTVRVSDANNPGGVQATGTPIILPCTPPAA